MNWLQITLAYDGSLYAGWQRQSAAVEKKHHSVQAVFEDCLRRTFEDKSIVASAVSRTDRGVCARCQIVFVRHKRRADMYGFDYPIDGTWKAITAHMNTLLTETAICVKNTLLLEEKPDYKAVKLKRYIYYVEISPFRRMRKRKLNKHKKNTDDKTLTLSLKDRDKVPSVRPYHVFSLKPFHVAHVRTALSLIRGEHDFKNFARSRRNRKPHLRETNNIKYNDKKNNAHVSNKGDTIRNISLATVDQVCFKQVINQESKECDCDACAKHISSTSNCHTKWDEDIPRLYAFTFEGPGFLKHMVRMLAAALISIGTTISSKYEELSEEQRFIQSLSRPSEYITDIFTNHGIEIVAAPGFALHLDEIILSNSVKNSKLYSLEL